MLPVISFYVRIDIYRQRFFYQHCLWLSVNKCGCKHVSDQLINAILAENGEDDVSVCASSQNGSDVDYPKKGTINENEKG
jgi:hypothetical protein